MDRFNPLDFPICLALPHRLGGAGWEQHAPFVFTLVDALRPRIVVDQGAPAGDSYWALCQAIQQLGLGSRAFGITAGSSVDQVERCDDHHLRYGHFSRLLPGPFDEALHHFSDGSVDLLHLDGLQGGGSARRALAACHPKVSERGVVLLHGTNGGVGGELWQEVRDHSPSFVFAHGHGLGVLAVGPNQPEAMRRLLASSAEDAARVRSFYAELGQRLSRLGEEQRRAETALAHFEEQRQAIAELRRRLAACAQDLQVFRLQIREREDLLEREYEDKLERDQEQAAMHVAWREYLKNLQAEMKALRSSRIVRLAEAASETVRKLNLAGWRRHALELIRSKGRGEAAPDNQPPS